MASKVKAQRESDEVAKIIGELTEMDLVLYEDLAMIGYDAGRDVDVESPVRWIATFEDRSVGLFSNVVSPYFLSERELVEWWNVNKRKLANYMASGDDMLLGELTDS